MVLSAPPPDDSQGAGDPGWIERVARLLRLSRRGVLILVDRAADARLGELVRALSPEHPELEVYTEPQAILEAAEGSALILAPRPEDAGWLNMQRPIFAERALRVVLWCSEDTAAALARRAPDFFDWVGHRVECPRGVPCFAILGLRSALRCRAQGIAWTGGGAIEEVFKEALPGRKLLRLSVDRPMTEIVEALRNARGHWVHCIDLHSNDRLLTISIAMRKAKRRGRLLVDTQAIHAPSGWWPLNDSTMPLEDARGRFAALGAPYPGRMATLSGLEPEAVHLATRILHDGAAASSLEDALVRSGDPGVTLAVLAEDRGLLDIVNVASGKEPAPVVWRAFGADPRVARMRREGVVALQPLYSIPSLTIDGIYERAVHSYPPISDPIISEEQVDVILDEFEQFCGGSVDDTVQWQRPELGARFLGLLAVGCAAGGHYADAEDHLRKAMKIQEAQRPPNHRDILWTSAHLAAVLAAQGRHAEAKPIVEHVIRGLLATVGPKHRLTALARAQLAGIRHGLGEADAGEEAREALASLSPADPSYGAVAPNLKRILALSRPDGGGLS